MYVFLLKKHAKMTIFSENFLYFYPESIPEQLPPKNLLAPEDGP